MEEYARHAALDLEAATDQVRAALANVDARIAFASYALYRLSVEGKDRPASHGLPMPAALEHAAWLLYPEFGKSTVADPGHIQTVIDAIGRYETAVIFSGIFGGPEGNEPYDPLSAHLRLHSGMVRGSAYPQQVARRIENLLRPFEAELRVIAGVGPWRAFELTKSLGEQMEENVNGMRDVFRENSKRVKEVARKGDAMSDSDRDELERLRELLQSNLAEMGGEWIPTLSQIFACFPDLPRKEWDSFRDAIGLTPGSRAGLAKPVDVQDRPVFFLDDERAFYVHGVECFDAVFAFFDDLARREPVLRDRYGLRVAEWMEEQIELQMKRLFPDTAVIRSACFVDPDNPGGETEADIVVVWGPFLIVAEAKGKRIDREALRGSDTKLKKVISANIQDAFFQARRVIRVLERDGRITFKEKASGRKICVQQQQLRRVMPVSVTLQHLSGIPTQLAITQRLGLFKGNAYPWSVSIDDLDVVTRFSGSPDVLLHYIERRTVQQKSTVGLRGDELDIFGQYLDNRLHPTVYEERDDLVDHDGPGMIAFNGGEEQFERVYFAEWMSEAPPTEAVELKVPPEIRAVLAELRTREDAGARWITFALLGLSNGALARLDRAIQDLRRMPAEGTRILRTTAKEDDVVINVLAHRGMDAIEFRKNGMLRTRIEHYRTKPRATITLGIDQRDTTKAFDSAHWMEGEWEREEIMEQMLAEDRGQIRGVRMLRNAKKPSRNDTCPCGSGRKFKRCCLGVMTFQRSDETDANLP